MYKRVMTGRVILAVLFIVAGVLHFVITPVYVSIVPTYLPAPTQLVWISGVAEVLGGLGLMIPFTRTFAACGLVLLLLAVMPANLNMALHADSWPRIPGWFLWVRLPVQIPLIYWAWIYTRKIG